MTPTSRPAKAAHQLAKLLDHPNPNPHQQLAARLTTLALTLHTVGTLATQRAHDQAPGIRATNLDGRRTPGPSDPTPTNALRNTTDTTTDLEHQLTTALHTLDHDAANLAQLIHQAIAVHRKDQRPTTECGEALCTEASTPGRLGYCETDYQRRYAWARRHHPDTTTDDLRRHIRQAPALTREALADRAIRKRKAS